MKASRFFNTVTTYVPNYVTKISLVPLKGAELQVQMFQTGQIYSLEREACPLKADYQPKTAR